MNRNTEDEAAAGAAASRARCSEATLHGTYLVAHTEVVTEETDQGPPQGPFAQAGYEVFDGNGKVNGVFTLNFNGNVFRDVRNTGTYTVNTYTLNADCTGTTTFESDEMTVESDLFIAPDGSMYTFVQTNPPRSWWRRGLNCEGRPSESETEPLSAGGGSGGS
jgi:hypothetical protein